MGEDSWGKGMDYNQMRSYFHLVQTLVAAVRSWLLCIMVMTKRLFGCRDDDNDNGNINDSMPVTQQPGESSPQEQPTVVASHSMSLPSASLRTLAYFLERHDEHDGSLLQIRDRIGFGQQEGFLDADITSEMAHRLAAALPYAVPMETVQVVFSNTELHNDIRSEQGLWDALNGSIVGLLCKQPTENDAAAMSVEQLVMLPCVGLGIECAIDRVRRLFYILMPVTHNKLVSVNVLSLVNASLSLPLEALYRGMHSEASPHLAYDNQR